MEVVKKTDKYTVYKKKSGRFGVKAGKSWVNGEEKVKILVAEGLIKVAVKQEAPAQEEESVEAAEESGQDSPSEEATAE